MRSPLGLLILILITLLTGCEEEDGAKIRYKEEFRYINKTDSEITILSYDAREISTHKITKGDSLVQSQITPDIDEKLIINADSLKLLFISGSVVSGVVEINSDTDPNSCNLLGRNNYDYKKVNDDHFYSYTFTGAVCE